MGIERNIVPLDLLPSVVALDLIRGTPALRDELMCGRPLDARALLHA